jgi:2-polyprenyl-3-methyl-5-hydroxy-6-metoxy-1,4-benzoquinol methylase
MGYLLASPIRRWIQNPFPIISPYVHEGMTVLEPGPGMGFFTIPLAQLVGASGRVVAVDLQSRMIQGMKRRAAKAGLLDRIDCRISAAQTMGIGDLTGKVDFTLAFAMVHEFPDASHFFREAAIASKPNAKLLLAEPSGHVDEKKFAEELKAASNAGFTLEERPAIRRSQAALLVKR